MVEPKILFAPLQGFTDYYYRNAHHEIIGGVDEYYAPYLRLDNDKKLPKKQLKDIHPDNNRAKVIPQILVNNSTDFIYLAKLLSDFGYTELNLNLGCPYPMVTNRTLGSGLLNKSELVVEMLEKSLPKINIQVSVKMRLGLDQPDEITHLLPELNRFDLTKVIIHPRIARKLYKGVADIEAFLQCIPLSKHKLVYNGDIVDLETYKNTNARWTEGFEFMIGRGLLWDVLLAQKIKNQNTELESNRNEQLLDFHNYALEAIKLSTSGFAHAHNKMLQFWTYFAYNFTLVDAKKIIKKVKKCKTEAIYLAFVESIFRQK